MECNYVSVATCPICGDILLMQHVNESKQYRLICTKCDYKSEIHQWKPTYTELQAEIAELRAAIQSNTKNIEQLSEAVHNAWWEEKKRQGFHEPMDFSYHPTVSKNTMFVRRCDKCHAEMYPYAELPENVKDYGRVTVKAVLNAIAARLIKEGEGE